MEFPSSELWNYTNEIWTLPEVEPTCLELQNSYDSDVCILLYCCWIGSKSLGINEDDMQVLLDTAQPWQVMLKPLRDSRKMMQQQLIAMPTNLVDKTISNMNEMELNAEHMALLALEKALNTEKISPCDGPSGVECSLSNLKLYMQTLDLPSMDEVTPLLSKLLTAVFQDEEAVQTAMMTMAS